MREEIRKWRTTVSLDEFTKARKKFDAAGVNLYAYNYSFKDDFRMPKSTAASKWRRPWGRRDHGVLDRHQREASRPVR